jgi:hypothetical protein
VYTPRTGEAVRPTEMWFATHMAREAGGWTLILEAGDPLNPIGWNAPLCTSWLFACKERSGRPFHFLSAIVVQEPVPTVFLR